jgi:hypothetical protein
MKRIFSLIIVLVIIFGLTATTFAIQMTIDAKEDAGQFPEQGAYLKFVYPSGYYDVTAADPPWTSSSQVYAYATSHSIPQGWHLESAGNIWSSDLFVGDALTNLDMGIYRISVVGGAFMYDSFGGGWSQYRDQWRWQLHIQALRAIQGGQIVDYLDYVLGSFDPYSSAGEALQGSLGDYIDIPLAEGGSLIFWIWDNPNTIDNFGILTFDVVTAPIHEPPTFILIGTGLLFLIRRFRGSNDNLLIS